MSLSFAGSRLAATGRALAEPRALGRPSRTWRSSSLALACRIRCATERRSYNCQLSYNLSLGLQTVVRQPWMTTATTVSTYSDNSPPWMSTQLSLIYPMLEPSSCGDIVNILSTDLGRLIEKLPWIAAGQRRKFQPCRLEQLPDRATRRHLQPDNTGPPTGGVSINHVQPETSEVPIPHARRGRHSTTENAGQLHPW